MLNFVKNELNKLNIDTVSCLSLNECIITRSYLLEKLGISSGSVIIFAVPYLNKYDSKNISSYATSKDYHLFFRETFDKLISKLKARYPEYIFAGFSDHSPINELDAAAKAGLGVIGTNHLLITEKYSSFVFIGEIITDAILPSLVVPIEHCIDCKQCVNSCPVNLHIDSCLSALTQKKGVLDENEQATIKASNCAWGCDICQDVCPYTQKAMLNNTIYTNIDFFKMDLTPRLTVRDIENMTDEQFSERAYAWRGKAVIKRNLEILEEKEK